jgi:hypothetical protein
LASFVGPSRFHPSKSKSPTSSLGGLAEVFSPCRDPIAARSADKIGLTRTRNWANQVRPLTAKTGVRESLGSASNFKDLAFHGVERVPSVSRPASGHQREVKFDQCGFSIPLLNQSLNASSNREQSRSQARAGLSGLSMAMSHLDAPSTRQRQTEKLVDR